ncbi:MAG: hypothetical protein MJA29_07990, partial [Candidatus Omnitrophica bacterium]|nr:hypothetical protein [Candidatus Omnitrophota bacterium]
MRSETLTLTSEILDRAYPASDVAPDGTGIPSYLLSDSPLWTEEYPETFRASLSQRAGYVYRSGTESAEGYFVVASQREYDFQSPDRDVRGLVTAMRDPLGHETMIVHDSYEVLPTQVTDPAGLITTAEYDYRVLQPELLTDSNGNRQRFGFTPLGLPAWMAVKGKEGENAGDTDEHPGTRFIYNFLAFEHSHPDDRQPVCVQTIQREHHVSETEVHLPQREETIKKFEFSDGFGRLLQTRTQAEDVLFENPSLDRPVFGGANVSADQSIRRPGDAVGRLRESADPNVVVSGWQIYDNKGQVVGKYEPFFSTGWEYREPQEVEFGQKVTMFYDPRGSAIRTVNPDGSEQRFVHGVPEDLGNPDRFAPSPWEAFSYDANDNGGRTHPGESAAYRHHWNTPASIVVDALGR